MTDRPGPLRVLVVEDSPTARALLVDMLTSDPGITVVGEAPDGFEAVALALELRPDLITMDIQMPRMDGLEATRQIMRSTPTPILVVTANNPEDVELSLDATTAGALMVIDKPLSPQSPGFAAQRHRLLRMVKAMAQVKVVRRWSGAPGDRQLSPEAIPRIAEDKRLSGPRPRTGGARVVVIAASTGGPAVVQRFCALLSVDFNAPILVVQHIAAGFTAGLVHWLARSCALSVKVAEDGEILRRATVYVAPDDKHLGITEGRRVLLAADPPIEGFRPSATFLFETAAKVYGSRTAAMILTGMGSDGVAGLRTVHAAGGVILAQDEMSSVVFGMPREAIRAGVVDVVAPIEEMAIRIKELASVEKFS